MDEIENSNWAEEEKKTTRMGLSEVGIEGWVRKADAAAANSYIKSKIFTGTHAYIYTFTIVHAEYEED